MKIGLEILSDDNKEPCDRCKSTNWSRIGWNITPSLHDEGAIEFPTPAQLQHIAGRTIRFILCIDCLAHAIQSVTGWNIRALLIRYRDVSPKFGIVPVEDDEPPTVAKFTPKSKPATNHKRAHSKKGK